MLIHLVQGLQSHGGLNLFIDAIMEKVMTMFGKILIVLKRLRAYVCKEIMYNIVGHRLDVTDLSFRSYKHTPNHVLIVPLRGIHGKKTVLRVPTFGVNYGILYAISPYHHV